MDARGDNGFRYMYPQFDVQLTDNFGYVGSVEATKALKEFYELRKALRFHALRTSVNFGKTDIKAQKKKYHWADGGHVSGESIPFDGIPYIILDKNVYECEYGADHKMWRKERRGTLNKTVDKETKSEEGGGAKTPNHWKKRNCPAKIRMKEVMKFPDFQIEKDSRYKRNTAAEMLHDAIAKGEVRGERRIYIYLPSDADHRGHTVRSQVCASRQHVDGRIINLIDQLVGENVSNVEEITQNITQMIQDAQMGEMDKKVESTKLSQPSDADLSYHIQAAQIIHTYSGLYCAELEDHVARSMSKNDDQKFFFRKSSAKEKLLLVHQTLQQQRILERFALDGQCTLDSTCQTTLDSLPLLLVSIQEGNEPQEIIGSAILQEKSHSQVKEALEVLRSWNPACRPKTYIAEYDDVEIAALEDTCQGVSIHICDYHRVAAWTKWASDSMDCVQSRHTLFAVLESIANARTTEDYCHLLDQFRSSDLWYSYPALRTWFGSTWLPNYTMWAQAFSEAVPDPKPKLPEACSQLTDDNDNDDDDDSVAPEDAILTDSLRRQCHESIERLNRLVTEAADSQSLTNLLKCLGRAEKRYLHRTSDDIPGDSDEMDKNEDEESSGVRNPKRQKLELASNPNEITVNKEALREAIKEVAVQLENVTGPVEVIFENEVVEHEELTVSEDKT